MKIACPVLVNFDDQLIADGRRFFSTFKVNVIKENLISFPLSAKGPGATLKWLISRDGDFYEFSQTEITSAWALPLNKLISISKINGLLLMKGRITAKEMTDKVVRLSSGNRDFNNKNAFLKVLSLKQETELVNQHDMDLFFNLQSDHPSDYWPD